jgi:hypothetical protein
MGNVRYFREPSGRTNGNVFDREGRLLHCEGAEFGPGGGRRVTRTDLRARASMKCWPSIMDGEVTNQAVAETFGMKHNPRFAV